MPASDMGGGHLLRFPILCYLCRHAHRSFLFWGFYWYNHYWETELQWKKLMWESYKAYRFLMVISDFLSTVSDSCNDGKFNRSSHLHFYDTLTLESHHSAGPVRYMCQQIQSGKIIATYLLASKEKAYIKGPTDSWHSRLKEFYSIHK